MANSKPPDDGDDVSRDLDRLEAKLTAPKDQTFAELREDYCRLGPNERQIFRDWVERLASAKRPVGIPLHASAKVYLLIPLGEEYRELLASPTMLFEAMQAWDQGQEFLPGVFDF